MPKKTKIWMFFATAIAWLLLVGASRSFLTSLSKLAIRWLGNLYISITSLSGIPNKLTRVEKCLFKHTHLNLCYASPVFLRAINAGAISKTFCKCEWSNLLDWFKYFPPFILHLYMHMQEGQLQLSLTCNHLTTLCLNRLYLFFNFHL